MCMETKEVTLRCSVNKYKDQGFIKNNKRIYSTRKLQPDYKIPTSENDLKTSEIVHGTSKMSLSSVEHGLEESQPMFEQKQIEHESNTELPKKHKRMHANLSGTKYNIIQEVCLKNGFSITKETDANCYFIWNDSFILAERVVELKPYQKINHFPGMGEICRKNALARHMNKMEKSFPQDFNFTPNTWILPAEFTLFSNHCRELKKRKKQKTYIVKPANGAMGNGIYLVRNTDRIPSNDNIVIQEYVDKPMLLDGYKFDLRVYVLVTSCDPLRIFIYNDGLVRLGTVSYNNPKDENLNNLFMHLTNYSVNKHNENFSRDEDTDKGSKRSLSFLCDWLKQHGYNVATFWSSVIDIVVKTIIVAQPHVLHSYRLCRPGSTTSDQSVCFEILGFDILLDSKMKPWLLEVNRSPSFGTDSKLDYDIKSGLLQDAIKLLNIRSGDKRRGIANQKAQSQRRLFTQPRRSKQELSDDETKKLILDKRIKELKERLYHIRRKAEKEDYELRNLGNYRSIYPPRDKNKAASYLTLLEGAFKLFSSGKTSVKKEDNGPFSTLKEEEILDLLEQYESDENFLFDGKPSIRGPKPLSSMPCAKAVEEPCGKTLECSPTNDRVARSRTSQQFTHDSARTSRPRTRPATAIQHARNSRLSRSPVPSTKICSNWQDSVREEELTRRTLTLLNEMKIKFPGKTDDEAVVLLNHAYENWKIYKERVANYWLVKLDSAKRRKVIDIAKTNVSSVLQKVWGVPDPDRLKLSRLFTKIFNRMLWSHGQGLWNCFSMFRNSWETMFNKSTDVLTPLEMSCCRRTVALCKECLLVVYLYAATETNQLPSDSAAFDTQALRFNYMAA